MKKSILITGGNGYIATSLYKTLKDKYNITIITRKDFDLTDYTATCMFLENKYFDIIIHTAVVGGNRLLEENESILKTNLDMYYNLINNKEHFDRFISFGSGAELEWPTSYYGYSKQIIAESMSKRDYCLNLRIFAVFDENELDRRFIKSNIIRYINKEPMLIHKDKEMDFFYMKDLVNLVDYYIQSENWLYSNIDCNYVTTYSLTQIVEMINCLSDYRVNVYIGNDKEKAYSGNYIGLPISLIGLENGIKEVYLNIKTKL
jgi:nucleoside-diphosphate-sugar epimerase